jgi:putative spermidine/putrescine transport system permease protein
VGFLAIFLALPLWLIVQFSFGGPEVTLAYYREAFQSTVFLQTLTRTFETALVVTVICLCIGYPYAYLMTIVGRVWRTVMMMVVLLPFWTSVLVRTYAWQIWLQDTGVINTALQALGIIESPLALVRNEFGVVIGMTQILLPYMVLPLFANMSRIDKRLVHAALSLGGRPSTAFRTVFLPLSLPGVTAGSAFVFILALGFYIIPAILGGPRSVLLSQLIVQQAQQLLNWNLAGAMAITLFGLTLILLAVVSRVVNVGAALGEGEHDTR